MATVCGLVTASGGTTMLHILLHTQQATGLHVVLHFALASIVELVNPALDATTIFDAYALRAERSLLGKTCAPVVMAKGSFDIGRPGARSYTVPVRERQIKPKSVSL